jgi:hypothetical protein
VVGKAEWFGNVCPRTWGEQNATDEPTIFPNTYLTLDGCNRVLP